MWLIIYFLIGWSVYTFLSEIIFNREEGIPTLEYILESGITPEELDFKLFVLLLFWPILIIYIIVVYGGRK